MSFFSVVFLTHSLLALGSARLAAADYNIDNANYTLGYSATGTNWRTFSFSTQNLTLVSGNGNVIVDSSKCYDGNYALAACTVENKCQIIIPFTGSGITVYVLLAGFQGVNASLAIDGGQAVTATLQPPSLPSSDHTATINILDWDNGDTSLYFDWAHINESLVELPTSPSTSSVTRSSFPTSSVTSTSVTIAASSSTTQSASISSALSPASAAASFNGTPGSTFTPSTPAPSESLNLGAVVGGACGGLAAVIMIIASIVLLKKRQSRHAKLQESRKPDPFLPSVVAGGAVLPLSPAHPPPDEKTLQRLAARNAVMYYSRGLADSESSDFHIHSSSGEAGRAPNVDRTADSFSRDDLVIIDAGREDGSVIDIHGSGVQNTATPSAVAVGSVPPPVYQSLEPKGSNNPSTHF
ncbi:hypothetical protein JVU11DRAFT_301 [Chiua virens]|nr:hypothetical protein JVU11DRAFT_301 [Chiua virens]